MRDKGELVAIVAINLSKAFDVLQHDLLLAKLKAYGVGEGSCALLKDYLSGRQQRVKIGDTFSNWVGTRRGVPQGSVSDQCFLRYLLMICLACETCKTKRIVRSRPLDLFV